MRNNPLGINPRLLHLSETRHKRIRSVLYTLDHKINAMTVVTLTYDTKLMQVISHFNDHMLVQQSVKLHNSLYLRNKVCNTICSLTT